MRSNWASVSVVVGAVACWAGVGDVTAGELSGGVATVGDVSVAEVVVKRCT